MDAQILIVDDSEIVRTVLIGQLTFLGYQADVARGGGEAIEMATGKDYALILMDIFMPDIDGIEATKTIRQARKRAGAGHVPIVAVTGGAEKHACQAGGLDDYVMKPILLDDLRRILNIWLHQPKAVNQ